MSAVGRCPRCAVIVGLDNGRIEHHDFPGGIAYTCPGTGQAPDTRTDLERAEAWARAWGGTGHVQVLLEEYDRRGTELARLDTLRDDTGPDLPLLASHVHVRYDLDPGELDGMLCGECPEAGPVHPARMLVLHQVRPGGNVYPTGVCSAHCGDEALRPLLRANRDGHYPGMVITLRAPAAWDAAERVAS